MIPWHRSLYLEHLEELSFLQENRRTLITGPNWTLSELAELDERIEAHVYGLFVGEGDALKVAVEGAESGDAGVRYGATRVFCRANRKDLLDALIETIDWEDEDERLALNDALTMELPLAWKEWVVDHLANAPPAWAALLAEVAAKRALPICPSIFRAAKGADPQWMPSFLWALGQFREPAAVMMMFRYLQQDNEALGYVAAMAGLRIQPEQIYGYLRDSKDAYNAIPLAISGDARAYPALLHATRSPDKTTAQRALIALGLFGDVQGVEPLLRILRAHPELAEAAAIGLYVLTGAEILIDEDSPEFEDWAMTRLSSDPEAWNVWWKGHQKQFQQGQRVRFGQPYGPDAIQAGLTTPYLPGEVRTWIAEEVAIRHQLDLGYRHDMLAQKQWAAVKRLRAPSLKIDSNQPWPGPRPLR